MAGSDTETPLTEPDELTFSRLEATLVETKVAPRPNSIEMKDVWRHAQVTDLDVNELDFNFSLDSSHYPLNNFRSLQQVFDAVQHEEHLANPKNFSEHTFVECLDIHAGKGGVFLNHPQAVKARTADKSESGIGWMKLPFRVYYM
jgi:hypothetical protein